MDPNPFDKAKTPSDAVNEVIQPREFRNEYPEVTDTEGDSSYHDDSSFDRRSSPSSSTSSFPPRGDEIDQWQRHVRLEDFGKNLEQAAKAITGSRCRYAKVYVLLIKWKTEDPRLPVSYEIEELRAVLEGVYNYEVETFDIPDKRSHAKVSERINSFVDINDDSKDDLKIVYYAGHSRLSKTRDLVWSSLQNKKNEKCSTVTWTGIQHALEQAMSDIVILLDCCSSGIGNAGEGNGVTELMSACAFDVEANGVGNYSFTKALIIELRLLSRKVSFSIGELYTHIYCRAQHHMAQGIENERYPAPIHLVLTRDDHFPRSIQLSIQRDATNSDTGSDTGRPISLGGEESSAESESSQYNEKGRVDLQGDLASSSIVYSASAEPRASDSNSIDSCWPENAPRLLIAIRLKENVEAEDLSPEYFAEWLRLVPTVAKEIKVEAGFKCYSTLILLSLPLSIWAYLLQDPAIFPLGPVISSNLLLPHNPNMELQEFLPGGSNLKTSKHNFQTGNLSHDDTEVGSTSVARIHENSLLKRQLILLEESSSSALEKLTKRYERVCNSYSSKVKQLAIAKSKEAEYLQIEKLRLGEGRRWKHEREDLQKGIVYQNSRFRALEIELESSRREATFMPGYFG